MKRLTLLRHAKSGDDGLVARDFDRRLNAKGRRAARAIGRHLRESGARFDTVIASPAVRVAETIEEVAAGYGPGPAPDWRRGVYLASAEELLELVKDAPEASESLLLVGHNPGLEELVLLLVPAAAPGARREAVEEKYPTASVAQIDLDVAHWDEARGGVGRLVSFVRPRDLDPALGPEAP